MRFFIFLIFILLHTSAYSATSCEPGYWLNQETAECELCPAGYFCCQDRGVLTYPVYKSALTSDCAVYDIPAGYELVYEQRDEHQWRLSICPGGYYCPGKDIVIPYNYDGAGTTMSGGVVIGRENCGFAYSEDGSDSADDCIPCPAFNNENLGYYGVLIEPGSSIDTCNPIVLFGDEVVAFSLFEFYRQLFGFDGELNPNYVPNSREQYVVSMAYDPGMSEYYIQDIQPIACGGGYYFVGNSDSEDLPVIETIQDTVGNICIPVETGYWSPPTDLEGEEMGLERYACPSGTSTTGYGTGADSADDCRIGCDDGYAYYDGQCLPLCGGGISHLHIGNDVSIPLFADRHTTPALNVMFNDQICFINVAIGTESGTLNINHQGTLYHAVK